MQYEIKEAPFTIVECQLEAGESMKCQSGSMAWMSRCIEMQTKTGGLGGMFKKALTGESLFYNNYVAKAPGSIAFAMHFPGRILALDVTNGNIIAQKRSFLACESTVQMDIAIQQKVGAGFFGGEGFIMQKYSGSGVAFLEIDGAVVEKELAPGEQIVVDSGYVAAMQDTVQLDIEMIKGIGNVLGGGEGLFNTVLTGPGKVWLQTMPVSTLVSTIIPMLPTSHN